MKKQLLLAALTLSSISPLAGCAIVDAVTCIGKPQLKLFIWDEYMADGLIDEFEDEYDVCVKVSYFSSNDYAIGKMDTEAFDLVFPSDWAVEQLAQEEKLQEIDWDKVDLGQDEIHSEIKSILDELSSSATDSFTLLDYGVPYFFGNMGILYDADKISPTLVEELQWNTLRYQTTSGDKLKVAQYDTNRDAFMVALKQLGYSVNTTDLDEIEEAKQWLIDQREMVGLDNLYYVNEDVIQDMANGFYDIAHVFSGDATYIMQLNAELDEPRNLHFYTPTVGTNAWVDSMVIPVDAPNTDLAYDFINFISRTDVAQTNAEYVGYVPPIQSVYDALKDTYFADQADSFQIVINENDEIYRFLPDIRPVMVDAWAEVKG